MKIRDALEKASQALKAAGLPEARMEAEFLVGAALNIPRTHLILKEDRAMNKEIRERIESWTAQRAARQPLSYITGEQPFMDLSFQVTSTVLIPRPETELLVEQALAVLNQRSVPAAVADVGTGSGCIAVCLARHENVDQVFAIDISPEALTIAAANARRYEVFEQCQFLQGDLLEPLRQHPRKLDIITANLPYVTTAEMMTLQDEVKREPRLALDGGVEGLDLIFRLLPQALQRLKADGHLFLEIGAGQGDAVANELRVMGGWTNVQVLKDLAGLPRIVRAVKSLQRTSAGRAESTAGKGERETSWIS